MNKQKREQIVAWLESMPWWAELPYAQLEAENAELKRSITDGRLTHIHFRAWANSIANEKGYSGSEIETLCLRLADALLTAEESE